MGEEIQNLVAQEVERIFVKRGWQSIAQAEIATGIPAGTIKRLRHGLGKAETVTRFGVSAGESYEAWSRIAHGLPPETNERISRNIERIPALEDFNPEGYNDYDDVPPEIERLARKAAEAAAEERYKGFLEGFRAARRESPGTVVGPAPDDNEE